MYNREQNTKDSHVPCNIPFPKSKKGNYHHILKTRMSEDCMPITKKKFNEGKLHSKVEAEIFSFLKERKETAFTSQEIMDGIHYHTDFNTPEISKMSTFAIADFTTILHHLVRQRTIVLKVFRNRMYYRVMDVNTAKCPECKDFFKPKKTWKMAGRPDKNGKRFQLHIGFYKCPKHGTFRKVLDKRKI